MRSFLTPPHLPTLTSASPHPPPPIGRALRSPDMPHTEREADSAAEGLVAEKCLGTARPLESLSCSSRTFYRGAAFAATDERHAVGATTALPNPTANAAACLSEGGLELLYHASSLAIIHFQVGTRTRTLTLP